MNPIQHQYNMNLGLNYIKLEITRTCSVAWEGWCLQLVYFVILKSSLAQLPLQAVDAHAVSELDRAGLSREIAIHFFHHNPHHCYKGQFGEQKLKQNKTCGSFSWQGPVLVTSLIIVIQEIQINLPHPSLISFWFNSKLVIFTPDCTALSVAKWMEKSLRVKILRRNLIIRNKRTRFCSMPMWDVDSVFLEHCYALLLTVLTSEDKM